jgi:hypothetical protein
MGSFFHEVATKMTNNNTQENSLAVADLVAIATSHLRGYLLEGSKAGHALEDLLLAMATLSAAPAKANQQF